MPLGAAPTSVRFGLVWAAAVADMHAANAKMRNCQCTGLGFDIEPPWTLESSRKSIRFKPSRVFGSRLKKRSLGLLQARNPETGGTAAPAQAQHVPESSQP